MKLVLGMGCDRGASLPTLEAAIDQALGRVDATRDAVAALATIDKKRDESALVAVSVRYRWPIYFFDAEQLAQVTVPNPSETVRRHMGTPAVSEAAALLAGNVGLDALILEKHKYLGSDGKNATVSIVRISNE